MSKIVVFVFENFCVLNCFVKILFLVVWGEENIYGM